ncbi:hypothetical protein A2Y83_03565 [Candidatus Falkowbacteria bacterium RBG_13_39_14]|uniref:Uncharacterized protein n=1 Tax=Candidatus Falkowbacteria bacterium RBG_13_39_14 TaxID=1797985 RepID=A0A1F5S641_9BACT|nr:MAG: hypothetical protein A2Y83_03565 [Candidatus Falkowbacteria bacterium RBG_13_39_14]
MNTAIKSKLNSNFPLRLKIFEEAQEAINKLKILKPLLTPQDEETLSILMDKKLLSHLDKSIKEANEGKLEPLKNILN